MIARTLEEVPRPDEAIMSRIRASWQALAERPDEFAEALYRNLFALTPESRRLFAADLGRQGGRMSRQLVRAVEVLDTIATLEVELRRLGAEHALRHGVLVGHYPYLGQALVHAVRELFPGSDDGALGSAWMSAYEWIAAQMIHGAAAAVPSYLPPRPRGVAPVPPDGRRGDPITQEVRRIDGAASRPDPG